MGVRGAWVYLSLKPRDSLLDFRKFYSHFQLHPKHLQVRRIPRHTLHPMYVRYKLLKEVTTDTLETTHRKGQKHTLGAAAYWGRQWTLIYTFLGPQFSYLYNGGNTL